MREREKKTELLAPAGSLQSVIAAVNAGADAIYMGGQKFGARAFAESAEAEEDMVMEAIRYCHLFRVKLYMTVNILFKDAELKELFSYIKPYYEAGVDGLIVQDLGAAQLLRQAFPDLEIHASTQLTITSPESALLMKELGFTRAVLARELSLREIAEIRRQSGIELEVFVHGAMCYSYSGACFMSSLLGGRSGNRGRCAGTCRLCYRAAGKKGYLLSMKDMETVALLPELIEAGAFSMKIEGRMKSPVYTAGVVSVYRKYLDLAMSNPKKYRVAQRDLDILHEIFDRGGVTSYLKKHNGADMLATEEKSFRPAREEIISEIKKNFLETNRRIPLTAEIDLSEGQPMRLTVSAGAAGSGIHEEGQETQPTVVTVSSEDTLARADGHAASEEDIRKQLSKTGGTPFYFESIRVHLAEGLFVPVSALNKLRRDALQRYTEAELESAERR